jgi:hypothetical protein
MQELHRFHGDARAYGGRAVTREGSEWQQAQPNRAVPPK